MVQTCRGDGRAALNTVCPSGGCLRLLGSRHGALASTTGSIFSPERSSSLMVLGGACFRCEAPSARSGRGTTAGASIRQEGSYQSVCHRHGASTRAMPIDNSAAESKDQSCSDLTDLSTISNARRQHIGRAASSKPHSNISWIPPRAWGQQPVGRRWGRLVRRSASPREPMLSMTAPGRSNAVMRGREDGSRLNWSGGEKLLALGSLGVWMGPSRMLRLAASRVRRTLNSKLRRGGHRRDRWLSAMRRNQPAPPVYLAAEVRAMRAVLQHQISVGQLPGREQRGSALWEALCEGRFSVRSVWKMLQIFAVAAGHAIESAADYLSGWAEALLASLGNIFGTRRVSGLSEYQYRLSFDECLHEEGLHPARKMVITGIFRVIMAAAVVLRIGRGGLSSQAMALISLFAISKLAIKDRDPSLEEMRTPFMGIVASHIFRDRAADIQVEEDHQMNGDAVWIWSHSAIGTADPSEAIVYIHGGGFISGDFYGYRSFCYHLSRMTGQKVLFLQYRLAPEHRVVDGADDVTEALQMTTGKFKKVTVVADSAGGGLALLAMQRLVASGRPLPDAAVLISPLVDLSCSQPSHASNIGADVMLEPKLFEAGLSLALQGHQADCPLVSAMFGSFEGLPPLYVTVSANEMLYGDAVAVCSNAKQAGVSVTEDVVDNLFHIYPLFYPYLPEARGALTRIRRWLQAQLNPGPAGSPSISTAR